jgi:class 3 adenylate cyclase
VASEVGDARWRELVGAFRATVRRQLKRLNGHEVDAAGDGFFAWFDSPARALQAAAAVTAELQALGLVVRCGLHTGELEQIDGRLGDIGAHIGARVMAAAGPAEILATSTVRELVTGGAATFDPFAEVELKGVPGRWALRRLTSVEGQPVVKPLVAGRHSSPRQRHRSSPRPRRPSRWLASTHSSTTRRP